MMREALLAIPKVERCFPNVKDSLEERSGHTLEPVEFVILFVSRDKETEAGQGSV